ncbi:5-formyltetrahydrofolate cyclo-ligase [Halanaerobium hydrogeniformans]|uniref:5-formyltetrahydrofolate cyclo-ligase n=1 Tax=Halanaerobium hydrogeniformans TaxID=656519 RepID=E4RII9_HALHG|nr:5-formyltetrahydrofolate cyclo-ligase [Halanaerobium hydrogeniformans]ADQ15059.1 5-formyltetrahydrofolate cyclo-ligase [Halanaerobium hydrogeniformans]
MLTKDKLRKYHLDKRSKITFEKINKWSKKICDKFLSLDELNNVQKIMSYISMRKEVNTYPLLESLIEKGFKVYAPYTIKKEGTLGAAQIDDLDLDLQDGVFGVQEPKRELRNKAVPDDLDIIIVPGAVYTKDGYRIGYGGGYYDKFLAEHGQNALKVAFCYDYFIIDDFPVEDHDIAVDLIITENQIIKI